MATDAPIAEQELREAYRASGIWRRGTSFRRALASTATRASLICAVKARRRAEQRDGQHPPAQLGLFQLLVEMEA